jgi:hypothetical protein
VDAVLEVDLELCVHAFADEFINASRAIAGRGASVIA